jgi:Rod binding domain-containing protein
VTVPATLPVATDATTGARLDAIARGGSAGGRRAAAIELQSLFLTQLLRAMRATVPENDLLPRSPMRDAYEGMFDRSVAEALAAGDPLGLVRALGADPPQDPDPGGR